MARGKKKQLPVSSKTEDIRKTNDVKGTKENKPETNEPPVCHGQATMHGFLSSSKTRSPLRQSPLALLHVDNSTTASVAPKDNFKPGEEGKQDLCHPNTVTIEATCSPSKDEDKSLDAPSLPQQQKKGRITKTKMKKPERSDSQQNRKVTDYYPIRRSSRKSKNELESEEQQLIEELIKNNVEEGLEVKHLEGKGRGVFACKEFQKGQFVVEYHGDLVEMVEAKRRERMYAQDPTTGCYMYYFQFHNKTYCVDATKETDRLGRLINHSKCGNCQTKLHSIQGTPHLILVASRDIRPGEELLYDYGDRSREAIEAHPWLKH